MQVGNKFTVYQDVYHCLFYNVECFSRKKWGVFLVKIEFWVLYIKYIHCPRLLCLFIIKSR